MCRVLEGEGHHADAQGDCARGVGWLRGLVEFEELKVTYVK